MEQTTIQAPVEGMTCAACAQTVEKALVATEGVDKATVNLATKTASITYDPAKTGFDALAASVKESGYGLLPPVEDPQSAFDASEAAQAPRDRKLRSDLILSGLLSAPVFVFGMFFMEETWSAWASMVLSAPVVFWTGRRFFTSGLAHLKNLNTNMDTLVALSTGVAWTFSAFNTLFPHVLAHSGSEHGVYFESAAVIVFFVLLGKWLEEKAGKRTRLSLISLLKLQPQRAVINRLGKEEEVAAREVMPGDELIIKPGMVIPVDGVVLHGQSWVEESFLTGESKPVEKTEKSRVWAGTVNQDGLFHMVAHKVGMQTYLAELIKAVVEAQGSKAPIQRLADRISGVFVPAVIAISLLTFIGWLLSGVPNAAETAFTTAISVLIIACPCALGLATPTAIMISVGVGARNGILIRNAEALERAASLRAVVVDKTGTITEGKPMVSHIRWLAETFEDAHAPALVAIERGSEHPMAKAIVAYFAERGYKPLDIKDFGIVRGRGLKATVAGQAYAIGSSAFMQELGIRRPVTKFRSSSETISYFATGSTLLAEIHIEDKVREGARDAVQNLVEQGVTVYLATGDQNSAAETVAQEVGIKAIRAQMLPHQKRAYVEEIQSRNIQTAMVGDGINDAEAMSVADVSIAMAKGSDLAIRVADITLAANDLRGVPRAIGLSKRTLKVIKQNLFWAFAYNFAAIPLAAGLLYPFTGLMLSPMIAGAAMAFSSVTVVLNSLKLNKHNFETNSFSILKKAGH